MITSDEIIESYNKEIKTIPTNFNEKLLICKTQNFYFLLAFLLIIIALLIAFSIYSFLRKYRANHLLPFRDTKLKHFCVGSVN